MSIQKGLRYVIYGALFIIPFIPLYVANSLFFPFITGKGFVFRILVEIAFFAWILLALANKAYRPRFSWVMATYTAFVGWMLIANLFAVNPHKALWSNFERMDGWVTMIHVFLFFVVTSAVLSADKLWRTWWMTFLGASALVSGYCLLQLSGAIDIHQGGVRVDGTFGNAAYLAAYLLFVIAIAIWYAFESKGWLRNILFALAVLDVYLVFETATRGAVLGLIAGTLVACALWMFESGKKSRKMAGVVFAGVVLVVGGVYAIRDSDFVKSEPTLARVTSISGQDLAVRSTLWGMALHGSFERPITGWGQEGFNYVFNQYYEPALYAQEPWFDRAHDVFIDWLIAGGYPALLLFLALFVTTATALYRREASQPERIMVLAALSAYAVQAIVVFDNLFTYVPLAAILATAHATSSRKISRIDAVEEMNEQTLQVATPLVAVLAVAIIWMVNVPNIRAAYGLVHGLSVTSPDISSNITSFKDALGENTYATQEIREQMVMFLSNVLSQQQKPTQQVVDLAQLTITEMGKEVEAQPLDARIRLEYALGYRVIGDYKNALAQVEKAHELSPRKQQILLEKGIQQWQIGDFNGARDTFRKAYDLDQSFKTLAAYAAAGEVASGNLEEGKKLLLQTHGTTSVNNEAVILAYYKVKAYPELIGSVEAQVREDNNSVTSLSRLVSVYVAIGRNDDARKLVAEMLKLHPEASVQITQLGTQIPK